MKIKNIGIIGAGIMGSGIAQVSAVAGYQVVLQDITNNALDRSKETIEKSPEFNSAEEIDDEYENKLFNCYKAFIDKNIVDV